MSLTPVIYSYLKKFQEDPTSRVFAPLAEAYRKAGLADEAISIAREGLVYHPTFIGGKVALARALFDKKKYEDVINLMTSVTQEAPDNLVAQRIFAESCLMVGKLTQALDAYKMLLYFNPQDAEVMRMVKELEPQAYEKGSLVLQADLKLLKDDGFDVRDVDGAIDADPDLKRKKWIGNIERLQNLLQRVERYRTQNLR